MRKKQKYEYHCDLRDSYSLIKGMVRESENDPDIDWNSIIRRHFTIHFDDAVHRGTFMWQTFCTAVKREDFLFQYSPEL